MTRPPIDELEALLVWAEATAAPAAKDSAIFLAHCKLSAAAIDALPALIAYVRALELLAEARGRAVDAARDALASIRIYGLDTLSGRADGGPDDRKWQREAVIEMTKRADASLAAIPASAPGRETE